MQTECRYSEIENMKQQYFRHLRIIFPLLIVFTTILNGQELSLHDGSETNEHRQGSELLSPSETELSELIIHANQESLGQAHELTGIASWYGSKFQGRETANGEFFDTNALTAAHKTLPFGSIVAVTNLENNKIIEVRINDRGPFVENRIIDLSRAAATALDFTHKGIAQVSLRIVSFPPEAHYVTLQISAFSDQSNALALQTELTAKGIDVDILQSSNKKIYRVSIEKLAKEDLEKTRILLAKIGYTTPLVKPYQEN